MRNKPILKIVSTWYLVFLGLLFGFALSFDLGFSVVGTRFLFVAVFALFGALISDWYYFRFSDSYRGISILILLGCLVSTTCVLVQLNLSNVSFGELITSSSIDWAGSRRWNLERGFQFGAAAVLVGYLGIPRLLIYEVVIARTRKIYNKIENEDASGAVSDAQKGAHPF